MTLIEASITRAVLQQLSGRSRLLSSVQEDRGYYRQYKYAFDQHQYPISTLHQGTSSIEGSEASIERTSTVYRATLDSLAWNLVSVPR